MFRNFSFFFEKIVLLPNTVSMKGAMSIENYLQIEELHFKQVVMTNGKDG